MQHCLIMEWRQALQFYLLLTTTTLWVVHTQPSTTRTFIGNCPRPSMNDLGRFDVRSTEGLVANSFPRVDGAPDPHNIRILAFIFVCEATGLIRDTLSSFSIIVRYECTGRRCGGQIPVIKTEQFQFDCAIRQVDHDGTFSPPHKADSAVRTEESAVTGTLLTTPNYRCGDCTEDIVLRRVPDPDSHCIACHDECVGLGRCLGVNANQCCNYYYNNECVISCPSPLVPNSNFICVDSNSVNNTEPSGGTAAPLSSAIATQMTVGTLVLMLAVLKLVES